MTERENRKLNKKIMRLGKMLIRNDMHNEKFHKRYMMVAKKIDAVLVAEGFPSALKEENKDDR